MNDRAATPVLDGYVLVDKPAGVSSFSAVQRVRRALGIGGRRGRKAGHAGTLDPFATGLLLVTIGHATRLMPWLVGHDKRYLLRVALGSVSSTDDATGDVVDTGAPMPGEPEILAAVRQVAALEEQCPPVVSAIHIDGERAYRRVRRGEEIEMPPRPVSYRSIDVVSIEPGTGESCDVVLDVECASGTYMRSLARDLGDLLGCGGLASELRRLAVGQWSVEGAPLPEDVTVARVRPAVDLVAGRAGIQLSAPAALAFAYGQRVHVDLPDEAGEELAVTGPDGMLLGIASVNDHGVLRPRTVFVSPASIAAPEPAAGPEATA